MSPTTSNLLALFNEIIIFLGDFSYIISWSNYYLFKLFEMIFILSIFREDWFEERFDFSLGMWFVIVHILKLLVFMQCFIKNFRILLFQNLHFVIRLYRLFSHLLLPHSSIFFFSFRNLIYQLSSLIIMVSL